MRRKEERNVAGRRRDKRKTDGGEMDGWRDGGRQTD